MHRGLSQWIFRSRPRHSKLHMQPVAVGGQLSAWSGQPLRTIADDDQDIIVKACVLEQAVAVGVSAPHAMSMPVADQGHLIATAVPNRVDGEGLGKEIAIVELTMVHICSPELSHWPA
ncbi:hypothetical protein GCM10023067_01670 [Aminobacter aganoensis]